MPVLLFFVFVALVSICTLALGYRLASIRERTTSRGCRRYRGRKVRRQRVWCRLES